MQISPKGKIAHRWLIFTALLLAVLSAAVAGVRDWLKIYKGAEVVVNVAVDEVDSVCVASLGKNVQVKGYDARRQLLFSQYLTKNDSLAFDNGSVSLLQFSAYKKGDDWAPALERALALYEEVYVPEGTYACSLVNIPSGKRLRGAGAATIFVPLGVELFRVDGQKSKEIPVARDVVDYSDSIALQSTDGLTVGTDILVQSQRNCMLKEGQEGVNYDMNWVLGRSEKMTVFYGEFDKVKSVEGNVIRTVSPRQFPAYYKDHTREPALPSDGYKEKQFATVAPIVFAHHVQISDFTIQGTSQCYKPILLKYADSCVVDGVRYVSDVETFNEEGTTSLTILRFMYCRDCVLRHAESVLSQGVVDALHAKVKSFDSYSLYNLYKIESSWRCGFEDCSANGATHAFNVIKSNALASICSGDCFIRRCSSSHNVWGGVKVSQGCWKTEISGCTVSESAQGIVSMGRLNIIRGNKVSTTLPLSTSFYYTHIFRTNNQKDCYFGGTAGIVLAEGYSGGHPDCKTQVEDNEVAGFYTGISIRDGYEAKNIFEMGHIDVLNNQCSGCVHGLGIYRNGFSDFPLDMDLLVKGNRFERTKQKALPAVSIAPSALYVPSGVTGVTCEGNMYVSFE